MVFTGLTFVGPDEWNFGTDPMILGVDEEGYDPGEGESLIPRLASQESVGTIYYFDFAGRGCIPSLCALYLGLHVKHVSIPIRRRPWMIDNSPSQLLPIFKKPDGSLISDNEATKSMCLYICGLTSPMGRKCPTDPIQEEIFEIANAPPVAHSRGNKDKGDKHDQNMLNPILISSIPVINDVGNQEESMGKWIAQTADTFTLLGEKLAGLPGPFFSGSDPGYGDFCLWSSMDIATALTNGKWLVDIHPKMREYYEIMSALSEVKEWCSARTEHKTYPTPQGVALARVRQVFDEMLATGSSVDTALAQAIQQAKEDVTVSAADPKDHRSYLHAQGLPQALMKSVRKVLEERPENAVKRMADLLIDAQSATREGE